MRLAGKAAEIARVSAKGGFSLFWGLVVSTVVSAVGLIVLARVLPPEEYGLYTIALAAPGLIGTFRDWGMNSAVTKYTAQYSSERKPQRVRSILLAGLVFEVILGLALSFLSLLLSGFLAANIFRRPITALIQVSSFTILAGAFSTAAQAAFVGQENMQPNSVMLVFQAFFRAVLCPALVVLGFGASGAVVGYTVGLLGGGLVGVFLMFEIYNSLTQKNGSTEPLKVWGTLRFMFRYALPLSFSSIFNSFLAQFYNVLIAIYASNFLIGNYAVANNFAVLLSFFTTPIATMLFPAFSKLDSIRDKETLKVVFQSSIKYASLLVVPPTVAVMALAGPAVSALFGARYTSAPLFLALFVVNYLLTVLGVLSTGNLIAGQGETGLFLKLAIVNTATGITLAALLVPHFGVIGLIVTTIFDGVPALIISLYWINKHYNASVDWGSSAKILVSSAVAGALAYLAVSLVSLSSWPKLILGLTIFAAGFLLTVIATRTLKKPDIAALRLMTGDLGPLTSVTDKILNALEKLLSLHSP
ncbi:MAG TPA: oligosaccharide flippase family protein [Candidatus Bathyarchaeia archaeon]|nr:oligosaccharide flippase family protein [Candidatus Bathyarchaeia archaeon]